MAHANQVVVLERDGAEVRLTPEAWAQILVFLEDRGWTPAERRTAYLTGTTDVSKLDADSMVEYGQPVFEIALNNPFKVYPANVDMGKFSEFIEFARDGYFRIRWEG